jgi:hypothetical protein
MSETVIVEAPDDPAVSEAAVAVAEIQAERDVAIAEIQAEVASEAIEAQSNDEADIAWLRGELDGLRARCEMNEGALSAGDATMAAMLERLTMLEEQLISQAAILTLLTPPLPSEPETEPGTEAEPKSEAEGAPGDQEPVPEAAPPAKNQAVRKRRWM